MKMRYRLIAVLALFGTLATAAHADVEDTVFDAITGVTGISIAGTPRSFMGQPFNVDTGFTYSGTGVTLTGLDTILVSTAAVNYTGGIRLRVQLWDTSTNAVTGTADVFGTPVGGVQTFTFNPVSLGANQAFLIDQLNFAAPITMSNRTNLGITLNWQGNTGGGFVNTDNLTTGVRGGAAAPPLAAGSVPLGGPNFGYYRNASGLTNFNFQGGDARQIGANSALLVSLRGFVVPEPGTYALMAMGLIPLAGIIARRRKA